MTDNNLKESIQLAEALARELYTGKTPDSPLLKAWKEQSPALYESIGRQQTLTEEIRFRESIDPEEALRQLHRRLPPPAPRKRIITPATLCRLCGGIAAILVLLFGIARLTAPQQAERPLPQWAAAIPGNEKTSISTDGGHRLTLEEKQLSVVGNRLVNTTGDGKKEVAISLPQDRRQLIKLIVPAGGEHRLTLEDGTTIHVNAASELLFPAHFEAHARRVKLCGEAYFDVAPDKAKPFVVQLDDALAIEVTGTAFNVKTYPEEHETAITLTEGSITVRKEKQPLATLLPGQRFTYRHATGEHTVTSADLAADTDWTNDEFIFCNETIDHIMRKISRWYNVDITVSDDISHIRYTGILSRKQPLAETLETLRMTNELDFHLHGEKKIDVREKENEH
ncbi:FecR family protein [uncultured Bacteroides sp.]|uniref:FecR family protein n=2 Tax=uncultured Bacteroides sp. TaxID=162156 RepID=UPI0025DD2F2B|nr:FecR domain-containing protein [uncultured Bacteroides sp.]